MATGTQDWVDSFLIVGNQPALDLLNTALVNDVGPVELLPDMAALERPLPALQGSNVILECCLRMNAECIINAFHRGRTGSARPAMSLFFAKAAWQKADSFRVQREPWPCLAHDNQY